MLWKTVAGKTLTANQARQLLARGATSQMPRGFKNKTGQTFAARLRLDRATGGVSFACTETPRPAAHTGSGRGRRGTAPGRAVRQPPGAIRGRRLRLT